MVHGFCKGREVEGTARDSQGARVRQHFVSPEGDRTRIDERTPGEGISTAERERGSPILGQARRGPRNGTGDGDITRPTNRHRTGRRRDGRGGTEGERARFRLNQRVPREREQAIESIGPAKITQRTGGREA